MYENEVNYDNVQYDTFYGKSDNPYLSDSPYVTNPKRNIRRMTGTWVGNTRNGQFLPNPPKKVKMRVWYRTYSMRNWELIVNPSIWDAYR